MSRKRVRVDFREMPDYTKPERFRERAYQREMDPRDYDVEEALEMNDLYDSGDPWGSDASIWELDV